MKRIGFIINSRLPEWRAVKRGMKPHHLMTGWPDRSSPMHFMRYGWVAEAVNRDSVSGLRYELFKPWRDYDAVVFLKSMEERCADHAERLKERGVKVIFEANVDYYTEGGQGLADHLRPTPAQRAKAIRMTSLADGVIASSRHLAGICSIWNPRTSWVPDHVPARMIPYSNGSIPQNDSVLHVWWSGMPDKVSDLLAAGEALRSMGDWIHLHLVTGDLPNAVKRLGEDVEADIGALLSSVPHTIHRFRSVRHLIGLYASSGGVILSPRFLENPYNRSHTEWKITLGMACGLPAITSPQPSYLDVRERSADQSAVTICASGSEWADAFETARQAEWRERASEAARRVVRDHYLTEVVAPLHVGAANSVLSSC